MSRGASDKVEMVVHSSGPREVIGIGVPSFGMVHLFFTSRLLNMRMPMNRIVRWFFIVGKEVGEARNEIVQRALDVETASEGTERCSKLLFLDDDLLFHPDALLKLLQDDRPIVSGLYYTKTSVPTPLVLHDEFGGTAKSWKPGELVECHAHGMGLCLLDTEIFKRVRDEIAIGEDRHGYPAWFKTTRDEGIMRADGVPAVQNTTEDVAFLRHVRALGYQPVVDTSPQAFAWHLDTKAMTAYPQKQWAEFLGTGAITWETDDGPVRWEDAA